MRYNTVVEDTTNHTFTYYNMNWKEITKEDFLDLVKNAQCFCYIKEENIIKLKNYIVKNTIKDIFKSLRKYHARHNTTN